MASLLDPLGLVPRTVTAAKLGLRVAGWTEQQAMRALRARLAAPDPTPRELEAPRPSTSLDQKMRSLLDRALDQSTAGSQSELYHHIIDQLVPDEARIISALSDGSSSPLVSVRTRTPTGGPGRVVLANASLVGRTANLALPHLTSTYVSHLLTLGLLERAPEDPAMKQDYEILLAESYVLKAIKAATRGPLPARIDRRTVRITALGRGLWDAASGGQP